MPTKKRRLKEQSEKAFATASETQNKVKKQLKELAKTTVSMSQALIGLSAINAIVAKSILALAKDLDIIENSNDKVFMALSELASDSAKTTAIEKTLDSIKGNILFKQHANKLKQLMSKH